MAVKDRTHDISLIDHHVKDVGTLSDILNQAVSAAFPIATPSRYCDVYALLLLWEHDDLGVRTEVDELDEVFRTVYRYRTGKWLIPSTKSHLALVRRITQALEEADSSDQLLVVYYGGHAASSAGGSGNGITELIAACGFESEAPGVGEHSFTRSLIEELRYYGRRPGSISSAFLHNKVLARAMKSWNPRYASERAQENETDQPQERQRAPERRRTPIHIHLADQCNQRCIELTPLPIPLSSGPHQTPSSTGSSAPSTEEADLSDPNDSSQTSLTEAWPDPCFNLPKVLIRVSLEEEQIYRTGDWIEWLKSIPALANSVSVEGVYSSNSTLLLLSLPVAVWDLLPEDPAISFISFVKSCNLMPTNAPKRKNLGTDQANRNWRVNENRPPAETANSLSDSSKVLHPQEAKVSKPKRYLKWWRNTSIAPASQKHVKGKSGGPIGKILNSKEVGSYDDGKIFNEEGELIGQITEGDVEKLAGQRISRAGEILDGDGDVVGRVKFPEEGVEDLANRSNRFPWNLETSLA
ncbi:MAG: hypothetical protein Q9184_002819 [Pyrenodesmia sp. 2 TL-2023]